MKTGQQYVDGTLHHVDWYIQDTVDYPTDRIIKPLLNADIYISIHMEYPARLESTSTLLLERQISHSTVV